MANQNETVVLTLASALNDPKTTATSVSNYFEPAPAKRWAVRKILETAVQVSRQLN
jgi:hypothetical protein